MNAKSNKKDKAANALWGDWSRVLVDPGSRTYWGYLVSALLIAMLVSRLGRQRAGLGVTEDEGHHHGRQESAPAAPSQTPRAA